MGWFSESDEERTKRLREERIKEKKELCRQKKAAQRKKRNAEFQLRIDQEVAKHLEERSPENKQNRLEQLHGASSLLNSALGLEFAQKGHAGRSWHNDITTNNSENTNNQSKTSENVTTFRQLNRPF